MVPVCAEPLGMRLSAGPATLLTEVPAAWPSGPKGSIEYSTDDALPSVAGGAEVPGALTNTTPVVTTGAATATGAMAAAASPHPSSPAAAR